MRNPREGRRLIERVIFLCALASIASLILIFAFLFSEGFNLFKTVAPLKFLTGKFWYPISDPPQFGILPLILGSLMVTAIAALISMPLGIAAAVYISEVAPRPLKEFLKPAIELLASIPSVVLGFLGMVTLVPFIRNLFNLPTGLTALTGGIMLALMALPTIVSITEDALNAVPKSYRDASLALGATMWETIRAVTVPAAMSGIAAAVMLGLGRVLGETMVVLMVTGNAPVIPGGILQPVRTMTATIAAEMGETVRGSEHYFALFAIAIVLFILTFLINLAGEVWMRKSAK
jgi:phosphate transport system permease protein